MPCSAHTDACICAIRGCSHITSAGRGKGGGGGVRQMVPIADEGGWVSEKNQQKEFKGTKNVERENN